MSQPYPSEGEWWPWYTAEVKKRYESVGRTFLDDDAAFIWFTRCAWDIGDGLTKEVSASKHLKELEDALGITQPPIEPPVEPGERLISPIVGYVRTEDKIWADDSGIRSFRICSWFPALRCYRDNPEETRKELDNIAKYWQGVRIFWHLGVDWWTSENKDVNPNWAGFDILFINFLQECKARNLRVSLSTGDMQVLVPGSEDETPWHEHIARLCLSVDQHTVSWHGVWNEGWQNTSSDRFSVDYCKHIADKVKEIYPWGAHGLSDGAGTTASGDPEHPGMLDTWSQDPANYTLVHGTRVFPDSIRRCFNLTYEGHWLINQDENVGPGPDVYQRDDDPRHLFGIYTMMRIAGQMVTYFSGHGLKKWQQSGDFFKDWGFKELPELWQQMNIPENIQTWGVKPGHKSDSAIYPTNFVNAGEGPARCDGAQISNQAWFVASGGQGTWRICSRRNAHIKVWAHTGIIWEGNASAGQVFFTAPANDVKALVFQSQS
jgi:hypothetical protein